VVDLCLRLVSPQVYQLNTGHYLCRNKYYGRGLSSDGFRQALQQYMHNGRGLRRDLVEPILHKLRSLKAVLESQASYRFYSSSLLIIYEGKVGGRTTEFKSRFYCIYLFTMLML